MTPRSLSEFVARLFSVVPDVFLPSLVTAKVSLFVVGVREIGEKQRQPSPNQSCNRIAMRWTGTFGT